MSHTGGTVVQTQWSIDNTVFQSFPIISRLIQAVREDDAQAQAVYAFEALGSSILISPERISEGIQALSDTGRAEVFKRLLITIGLVPRGIATFVRNDAPRCVPTFMLVTALKTLLTDDEVGNVIYDMLVLQGLAHKPELRCSRNQLAAVIAAVSGYSDTILPAPIKSMRNLFALLQDKGLDSVRTLKYVEHKYLAEIYSTVFGLLQKEEVRYVSLEGTAGCLLIATTFLWLNEPDVELCIDDLCVEPAKNVKISIQMATTKPYTDTWVIKGWREVGTELLTSVLGSDVTSGSDSLKLPAFTPIRMAREVLRSQYSLTEAQTIKVGALATGLALVALERGFVFMDPPSPGFKLREVRLRDICQASFLSNIQECMHIFGWTDRETDDASSIADAIKNWVDKGYPGVKEAEGIAHHPLKQTPLQALTWILTEIEKQRYNQLGTPPRNK
ncbi:hypothetical protein PG985_008072 [Apiospora marii]|uniref:uncharacterized protein n=1 Tax=Apiospora marii TaxID=335849 RepID=UPI00312F0A79